MQNVHDQAGGDLRRASSLNFCALSAAKGIAIIMNIGIFPCQGRCNVSMMTKTVAEFFVDDEIIRVLPHLSLPLDNESCFNEKYIAINGCPAKCASKEFESARIKPHEDFKHLFLGLGIERLTSNTTQWEMNINSTGWGYFCRY